MTRTSLPRMIRVLSLYTDDLAYRVGRPDLGDDSIMASGCPACGCLGSDASVVFGDPATESMNCMRCAWTGDLADYVAHHAGVGRGEALAIIGRPDLPEMQLDINPEDN